MSTIVKLLIEGGNATPGPPIGNELGSRGIKAQDFCRQFNAMTQHQKGKMLRVLVAISEDKRNFKITVKGSPSIALIKKEAKIQKGSGEPNRNKVGTITQATVQKIAEEMEEVLTGFTKQANYNIIAGTARSLGVDIVN